MRFRARGAVRDVGKAMGLPEDVTAALAAQVWAWSDEGVEEEHAAALNLNMADRRLRLTLDLARQLLRRSPVPLLPEPGDLHPQLLSINIKSIKKKTKMQMLQKPRQVSNS
jgi:error-prone DNA polymerase